jgi:hypothetical protein
MFSGEPRWISKSWAAKVGSDHPALVDLPGHGVLRALECDLRHAQERAAREADEIIPKTVDLDLNSEFQAILEDRHMFEVTEIYSISPALYLSLIGNES